MAHIIVSVTSLDCAHKLRRHYLLPAELGETFLSVLPPEKLKINRFSQRCSGARDHFVLDEPGHYHISGVLGGDRLVVTYGKPGGSVDPSLIEMIEALLTRVFQAELVQRAA